MKVTATQTQGWNLALEAARATMPEGDQKDTWTPSDVPSSSWIEKMLFCEHSPIRRVRYWITIRDVKRWVVGHLIRHKGGVESFDTEPFVATQRADRTGIPRDDLPQGELSTVSFDLNAQALINMSRKRLCFKASSETREAWAAVRIAIGNIDAEVAKAMVPECVYRGCCTELKTCGYADTEAFQDDLYYRIKNK
jgi:hypothetical protein